MALAGFECSECGRPLFLATAEIASYPPPCSACGEAGTLLTVEDLETFTAEMNDYYSTPAGIKDLQEIRELLQKHAEAMEKEQANPAGIIAKGRIEQEEHNKQLAESAPPGWSMFAHYAEYTSENGWLYVEASQIFDIRAPDGSEGVFDFGEEVKHPPGWTVTRKYQSICYSYTITAPSGDVMIFDDWWDC